MGDDGSGGIRRSYSKGNLSSMGASATRTQASGEAVPHAPAGTRTGPPPLIKRSKSMSTFDGIVDRDSLSFGKEAVESISGKVTLPPALVDGPSGAPQPGGAPAGDPPRTRDRSPHQPHHDPQSTYVPDPASPALSTSSTATLTDEQRTTAPSTPRDGGMPASRPLVSPDTLALDDSMLHHKPMARVDYFSHDWNEMDIAGSWRYIVSRRQDLANSARLENASWRTWAKAKNNLKTVSPETVNWLKDYDVTWLYGPLYHDDETSGNSEDPTPSDDLDIGKKKDSDYNDSKLKPRSRVKSILKKKTVAQLMLEDSPHYNSEIARESLATTNYLRHHNYRHSLQSGTSRERMATLLNQQYSRPVSSEASAIALHTPSHPLESPASTGSDERHVHFNVRVEQCIALDPSDSEIGPCLATEDQSDVTDASEMSDDEEGGLFLGIRRTGSSASMVGSQTIAPLPATTLKTPEDPEAQEGQDHTGFFTSSGKRSGLSANYDYASVYPTNKSVSYTIVDPSVHAVEVPKEVADQGLGSTANLSPQDVPPLRSPLSTPSQSTVPPVQTPVASTTRRTIRPVASFGVN